MRRSWSIGSVWGFPVRLHWSFLLVGWVVYSVAEQLGGSWPHYGWTILLITGMFASVLAHELGHALAARRFGHPTLDITLSPLGGLARMRGFPESPRHALLIAAAGPAVNFLLVIPLALSLIWFDPTATHWRITHGLDTWRIDAETLPFYLFAFNLLLAVFNLLPAFPLDGGRMLRALLRYRADRLTATRIATRVGQLFGVVLIAVCVVSFGDWFGGTPWLGFGLFGGFLIYLGETEFRGLKRYERLRRTPVGQLPYQPLPAELLTDVPTFPITGSLLELLQQLDRAPAERVLLVEVDGAPVGILSIEILLDQL